MFRNLSVIIGAAFFGIVMLGIEYVILGCLGIRMGQDQ